MALDTDAEVERFVDAYRFDTWDDIRRFCDILSEEVEDWQGVPIPIPELPVRLHDRHPLTEFFANFSRETDGVEMEIVVGGPKIDDDQVVDEVIVNTWFAWKLNVDVQLWKQIRREGPPRFFAIKIPRSPDSSMDRLKMWIQTVGASDAWDLDAEHRARDKLRTMLSDRQWRHYDLTGSFFETSPRSRLTYVFRRLRPTLALTSGTRRDPYEEMMRCLAVLCLHPIGYYERTWAGCMVPSDDVIAHLMFMRADEAGFWRCANQHEPRSPEAGL